MRAGIDANGKVVAWDYNARMLTGTQRAAGALPASILGRALPSAIGRPQICSAPRTCRATCAAMSAASARAIPSNGTTSNVSWAAGRSSTGNGRGNCGECKNRSACGHTEPRTSESEARCQRKLALGVGPQRH